MEFNIGKGVLSPLARESGRWASADLQKKHLLTASLARAVRKITEGIIRAKSLWELSFYFTIIHQLGKEVFIFSPFLSPAPAHAHSLVLLPIGVVLKDIFLGLVIKGDIL